MKVSSLFSFSNISFSCLSFSNMSLPFSYWIFRSCTLKISSISFSKVISFKIFPKYLLGSYLKGLKMGFTDYSLVASKSYFRNLISSITCFHRLRDLFIFFTFFFAFRFFSSSLCSLLFCTSFTTVVEFRFRLLRDDWFI